MYNKDSDSLNTGAPEIRLTGNQDPNTQMASDPSPGAELFQMYQNALQSGQLPKGTTFEMFKELLQQSRAPQQNSGIMAAAPTGTYTQNRKNNMMAYGGIAGADGRKAYGIGSFFQDYIKDPIENYLRGPDVNQMQIDNESQIRVDREQGIKRSVPADFDITKDKLSDIEPYDPGTGAYTPGYEQIFDIFRSDNQGTEGIDFGNLLTNPLGNIFSTSTDQPTGSLPFGLNAFGLGNINLDPYLKQVVKERMDPVEATQGRFVQTGRPDENVYVPGTAAIPGSPEESRRAVNPLYPIAAGIGVGKYVSGLPKDELPMDTTSIDPAAIAAAARGTDAEGIAAGLRFLPEQVTRAASGGRIGYAMGGGKPHTSKEGIEAVLSRYQQGVAKLKAKYGSNWRNKMEELEDEGINMADVTHGNEYAQGGRIGAQEGGLMNLGGMEKDYRNDGGFVPIGEYEKKDDVPARLSKNEFVFTADAVRGAGGGDIDKGAEIMENMMKSLEAGGEVSEDSQGLEGARGMFANAQKLQKRII